MALLTRSANVIKYLMFAFNLLFVITGLVLISFGVVVAGVYSQYEAFLITRFFSIPTLLIVTGSLIFIIAFFGCFGAIKENYYMIITFSVLLGIILLFELAAGISGYVLHNDACDLIQGKIKDSMKTYNETSHLPETIMWDKVQREFTCCGLYKWTDWTEALGKNDSIPLSCCDIPNGADQFKCSPENDNEYLHHKGCLEIFSEFIRTHIISLSTVGVIMALIQLVAIVFGWYIAREIKRSNGWEGFY